MNEHTSPEIDDLREVANKLRPSRSYRPIVIGLEILLLIGAIACVYYFSQRYSARPGVQSEAPVEPLRAIPLTQEQKVEEAKNHDRRMRELEVTMQQRLPLTGEVQLGNSDAASDTPSGPPPVTVPIP